MNIRAKLTLQFSIIVASLLVLFSSAVYYFSATYRKEEFFSRLKDRALTTAKLLVNVEEVDINLLKIIDRNTINALSEERILVYDVEGEVVYASRENAQINVSPAQIEQVRRYKYIEFSDGRFEVIGMMYSNNSLEYIFFASAYDQFGRSKLQNLRNVLLIGLVVGIVIILISGRLFAGQALVPIAKLNTEVGEITAQKLNMRVNEGNRKDEVALLAMNFNRMLERLSAAFEMQQNFVSNASHELRTPLASIISQLQVSLTKDRSTDEYKEVLRSVLDDTRNLSKLTNGLLELAQSSVESQKFLFRPVRMDEALFEAQEELKAQHPDYQFYINFEVLPEDESALQIFGNEHLLKTVFLNLMENACKFSDDKKVEIRLGFEKNEINIQFIDKGVGIPEGDLEKIFEPFYRSINAQQVHGYGIGLSLCQKIVQLHKGALKVDSTVSEGTTITLTFPFFRKKSSGQHRA
ncbi:MAG TPA: HAMP domain-containing sensor histidine kinase [Saprospiraceae bacterium]|nr:HAMP domain-containing sensor histidine kinase [Saprospiraceae bacterium]